MSLRLPLLFGPVAAIVAIAGCGALSQQADIVVRVVDARHGQAVNGASVTLDWQTKRTAGGLARFTAPVDSFDLTVEHPGYLAVTTTVIVVAGLVSTKVVTLYPRPAGPQPSPEPGSSPGPGSSPAPSPGSSSQPATKTAIVFGKITDQTSARIPNAMIFVESNWGIPMGSARSNGQGEYKVTGLPLGQGARFTVIADGYDSITRPVTPTGDWRLDFTGVYAIKKPAPVVTDPGGPPTIKVSGRVEDTMGRALDGVVIRVESDNVRFPFTQAAIARQGRFELTCPAELSLRFSASKVAHRTVSFVQRLERPAVGGEARVEFTGNRALDPTPIMETKSEP